jgi:Zn-dependent protease
LIGRSIRRQAERYNPFMLPSSLADLIGRIFMLLIVFPVHELAHAAVATRFGDPTPRAHGRLTLNPLKHLDFLGSFLFVFAGVGWASTPVNPAYFGADRRLKMGVVSAAGPLANFILAVLGAVPFYFFSWHMKFFPDNPYFPDPAFFFTYFIFLNLLLGVFNLIPIAPLDGVKVLGALLPEYAAEALDSVQQYGVLVLFFLVFILPSLKIYPLDLLISYIVAPIMKLLFIGVR